jgi:hypothetical protein
MVKSRPISAQERPQGGLGKRKFAVVALLTFCFFAGFLATAQRAAADTGIPDSGAVEATTDPTVPTNPVSTAVSQDAATGQAVAADATAAEPQQSNTIEAAPTGSPGALSASQENQAAVVGAAANGASTGQAAGGESTANGVPSEADQQADTDQAADATASAVEPQQSNVVIIIRINSPGDDVISQTNVVSVVGAAANESSTTQQQGPTTQNPAPAGEPADGASDPTQSQPAGGPTPPTDGQPQPSGAVPQSAQSADAAQQPVQPAGAVQGQRPHGARALSILASSGGPKASPPAPEHHAASPMKSASRLPGDRGRSASAGGSSASTGLASGGVSKSATVEHLSASQKHRGRTLDPIRYHVENWLRGARAALPTRTAAAGDDGLSTVGLMTLAALIAGGLGWALLTWMPSLRGPSRPRIGG